MKKAKSPLLPPANIHFVFVYFLKNVEHNNLYGTTTLADPVVSGQRKDGENVSFKKPKSATNKV